MKVALKRQCTKVHNNSISKQANEGAVENKDKTVINVLPTQL